MSYGSLNLKVGDTVETLSNQSCYIGHSVYQNTYLGVVVAQEEGSNSIEFLIDGDKIIGYFPMDYDQQFLKLIKRGRLIKKSHKLTKIFQD